MRDIYRVTIMGAILCLINMLIGTGIPKASDFSFTIEKEASPVRLTYGDMDDLVGRIQAFLKGIEGDNYQLAKPDELSFADDEMTVAYTGRGEIDRYQNAPKTSYDARYRYVNYDGSIKYVTISLSDFTREITVVGANPVQVEALAGLITNDMIKWQTITGGWGFRFTCWFILSLVFMSIGLVGHHWKNSGLLILGASLWSLNFISGTVVPWDRIFPGTLILASDSGFFVRNTPLLTCLGFLCTLLTIGFGAVRSIRKSATKDKKPARKAPKKRRPPKA